MNNLCKECGLNEKAPGRSRCYSCYGRKRRGEAKPNFTSPTDMKVLFLDIETAPNLAWVWSLWKQNVGINQIKESGEVLCFAARWYGDTDDDSTMFFHSREDRLEMVQAAWSLLDQADVVVHYYGSKFDIPWLFTEFLKNGFPPPSPFKQIDLKNAVSKQFYFPSNKLQYVSTTLGLEGKEEHEGFDLWRKCMEGDDDAWARMESYNRQDVLLLEDLYEILLPWISGLPHRWLYDGHSGCPNCGKIQALQPAGFAYTRLSKFRQYRCDSCGSYFRDSRRVEGVSVQESVL